MLAAPLPWFMAWMLLWGVTVSGDSPQFSTLTAQNAPPAVAGSVLTFANCIGFAISVLGVGIFLGLTAWDTQKIKESFDAGMDAGLKTKGAVMGALSLYLDFLNLFLMLLRLFGNQRN